MYVSRLRVSGVRGFHGNRSVDLTFTRPDGSHAGWTVLAGRNGSGKTSLLRALAVGLVEPKTAILLAPRFFEWRSHDTAEGTVQVWNEPNGRNTQVSLFNNRTAGWVSDPRDGFAAGYGPFRRLSGGTAGADRVMDGPDEASRFVTLFHEEASLAEAVTWLINLHLKRLEKRPGASELLDTVLALLADGLLPDGFRVEKVDSEGLWVTRQGHAFPLREMSDGYRTVTALVLDLVRHLHTAHGTLPTERSEDGTLAIPLPGVVLVDEIDAHLHVSWQQRIGDWLKAHFPRIQFIVTTHSPYICQAADPGGLIRLAGPDEDAPPRVVDEDLYRRIVYGSGDDAVLSELFGLESPYSPRAVDLRQQLVELESRVLSGTATEAEVERYQQISHMLTSSLSARVDEVSARLGGHE